jgi:hypothetical protein
MKLPTRLVGFVFLFLVMFISTMGISKVESREAEAIIEPSSIKLSEGNDFATHSLRNAWDMSEFADISQALNQSGQANYLMNILVQDGVFSARSTNLRDAQFWPLWPGYNTAMLIGKVGHNYPIAAQTYHCLYIGMKVDSKMADNNGPDVFQVFWFANELLNGAGGTWGYSRGIVLYPEAGNGAPTARWKIYRIDLADTNIYGGGTPWSDRDAWQSIRIDPTNQSDVDFKVDWVRLTTCTGASHRLSWQGGNNVSIGIQPLGTSREFLIASNVSSPYDLDVQGLPAGVYSYVVKENNTVLSSGNFEINKTPIATFARPSPLSGVDYATKYGNPWDFQDATDVRSIADTAYSFNEGILDLKTDGGGGEDPIIELNTPQHISVGSEYRYLSFRMYTAGAWQNVPEGMIVRWIWRSSSEPERESIVCHLVSQDIPFDVGWQTYTIDLSNPFNGKPETMTGDCQGLPGHWLETSPAFKFRFDPNENLLETDLYQQLDWIRLTQVDRVIKGNPFPVQISLNKSPDEVTSTTFYYTDNLQNPTQHRAAKYLALNPAELSLEADGLLPGLQGQEAQAQIFLPTIMRKPYAVELPPVENAVDFAWDTSGVTPGEYYVCVVTTDQYNSGTYCSEAPVQVVASN